VDFSKPTKEQLLKLFNNDFEKFNSTLESLLSIRIENHRKTSIRNEYYPLKESFQDYFNILSKSKLKKILPKQIIQLFIEFKNEVSYIKGFHLEKNVIEQQFKNLCDRINKVLPEANFKQYIYEKCDLNKVIEELYKNINGNTDYLLSSILSEDEVDYIVRKASLMKQENIEEFLDRWVKDFSYSRSLLTLANRMVNIQPEKAKQMLADIADKEYDNLLFSDRFGKDKLGFNVVETLIMADTNFGKRYLLKSFISQKAKYFYELISSIDRLMEYETYFSDNSVAKTYFESNLEYNQGLAEGLPKKVTNYEFIEQFSSNTKYSEIIIEYIISLFDYPVIKIRELAMESLLDLFLAKTEYLEEFIKIDFIKFTYNKIEHILTVLIGVANKKPELLINYKKEIWAFLRFKHFNITQLSVTLFTLLIQKDEKILTIGEYTILENIDKPSTIILPTEFIVYENCAHFVYSEFQAELLYTINQNDVCDEIIQEEVYTDLKKRKGLRNYDPEAEGIVHRNYNINTNFDVIEIHSNYYEEVKNSLNEIVYKKIKRGCFDESFVKELSKKFRLYDPLILLINPVSRPKMINWLPKSPPDEFMLFKDSQKLIEAFINRESEYITLFESGSQRSLDGYRDTKYTTYFDIYTFLKKRNRSFDLEDLKYDPVISRINCFDFEMPSSERNIHSFPINGLLPILEVSRNNFRGEKSISKAMLAKEFLELLGFNKLSLFDLLNNPSDQEYLKAIHWQNAYTSGRRRYKPSSEGFTLKIDKLKLKKFLSENDYELCVSVDIKRANTPYINESHMNWKYFQKVSVTDI